MTNQLIDTETGPMPDPHALWATGRRRRQNRRTAMLSAGTMGAMAVVAAAVAVPLSGSSPRPAVDAAPATLPAATLAASTQPAPTLSVAEQLRTLVAGEAPAGSTDLLASKTTQELPPNPVPKADQSEKLSLLGVSYFALPGDAGAVTLAAVQTDPSLTLAQVGALYGIDTKPGASSAIYTTTAFTSDQNGWQVAGIELAPGGKYVYVHYYGPSKASLGSVDAQTLLDGAAKTLAG